MSTPRRIQLRRAKGWRMPENTVKVDRTTAWGNPFVVGKDGTRAECVDLYAKLMAGLICLTSGKVAEQKATYEHARDHRHELRGKNLACWCHLCPEHKGGKPHGVHCPNCAPCHADILLEIANGANDE